MHVLGKRPRFLVKTAGPELVVEILLALFSFPTDLLIKCILAKGQQIDRPRHRNSNILLYLCMFRYYQNMVGRPPQLSFSCPNLIKID